MHILFNFSIFFFFKLETLSPLAWVSIPRECLASFFSPARTAWWMSLCAQLALGKLTSSPKPTGQEQELLHSILRVYQRRCWTRLWPHTFVTPQQRWHVPFSFLCPDVVFGTLFYQGRIFKTVHVIKVSGWKFSVSSTLKKFVSDPC